MRGSQIILSVPLGGTDWNSLEEMNAGKTDEVFVFDAGTKDDGDESIYADLEAIDSLLFSAFQRAIPQPSTPQAAIPQPQRPDLLTLSSLCL
jgi:hypothetical protein